MAFDFGGDLVDSEFKETSFVDNASTSWDKVNLEYGEGVANKSRIDTFENYENYEENKDSFNAYADTDKWYKPQKNDEADRYFLEKALNENHFRLENGKVVRGENGSAISMYMHDLDAVKGGLLARQNGWNKDTEKVAYSETSKTMLEEYDASLTSASLSSQVVGVLAGEVFRKQTAQEIALSPGKIMGKTVLQGFAKAFAIEGGIAALGGISREYEKQKHAEKADIDMSIESSFWNILTEVGIAGLSRGIGSAVVDKLAIRKALKNNKTDMTDTEIVEQYFKVEQEKLMFNMNEHMEVFNKATVDIDNGKPVDVSEHLDMTTDHQRAVQESGDELNKIYADETTSFERKAELADEIIDAKKAEYAKEEEISIVDLADEHKVNTKAVEDTDAINKIVDEAEPIPTEQTEANPYNGMASKADGDKLIEDMAEVDPEIKTEMEALKAEMDEIKAPTLEESKAAQQKKKPLSPRAEEIQEASVIHIGGSEEEAALKVQQAFRKNKTEEARIKSYSKEDIEELTRMQNEEILSTKPKDFSDEDWLEANAMFAKFGDNITAGMIAGISEDEDGNITLDPEKFVLGLGGYTALKQLVKSKTIQKEFKGYASRLLDELESNPKFDYLTKGNK